MKNRFGKTTWAALSLVTLFLLLLAFGVARFPQTDATFNEDHAASPNNSETLWESLTHHLVTLAY